MEENYFTKFNSVDYSDKAETKNDMTYLPWAVSWGEIKKMFPMSFYTVYENEQGWDYFTDGRTCWVKTGVSVVFDENVVLEHIERLPVMDFRNQSIPLEKITSTDVNKAIQRSLTKAAARHGVGLYIYAGEDAGEELKAKKDEVINAARKKIKSGIDKTLINSAVAEFNGGSANPNTITSMDVCVKVLDAINNISKEKVEK